MLTDNCSVVQDGESIREDTKEQFKKYFENSDFKHGKIQFVGFIIDDDHLLISFPKHYLKKNEDKLLLSNEKDLINNMKLLFDVIIKCSKNKSQIGIDINENLNNGYPFKSFYEIYDYYLSYDVYSIVQEVRCSKNHGKIDWPYTMKRSSKILTKGGVVFSPLIIKKKVVDYDFISKCMVHSINHTIEIFNIFLDKKPIKFDTSGIDWTNRTYIVNQLKKEREKVFKDREKKLIENLIEFYNNKKTFGNKIIIKFKKFDLVWEEIMKYYLENYLIDSNIEGELIFSEEKNKNNLSLDKKKSFSVENKNEKRKSRKLEPDYYFIHKDRRYILDSKYYGEVTGVDYKQIAYYFLLKTEYSARLQQYGVKETVNVLMLPTNDSSNIKIHFDLNTQKYNYFEDKFLVLEQYFNIKYLMQQYVK